MQNKVRKTGLSKARRKFLEAQLSAILKRLSECEEQSRRIKKCLGETENVSLASGSKLGSTKAVIVVDEEVNVELLKCFGKITHSRRDAAGLIRKILAGKTADSYGKCSNCERRIPKKRLKIVPWASMCVPCQEAAKTAE